MPLFMDVHTGVDAKPEEVAEAHRKDLEIQEEYEVDYLRYWFDEEKGAIFCLFEGPNREAGEQVHREAHGLVAGDIYEVEENE